MTEATVDIALDDVEGIPVEPWTPGKFLKDAKARLTFIDTEIASLQAQRTGINTRIHEWREEKAGVERFIRAAEGRKRTTKPKS